MPNQNLAYELQKPIITKFMKFSLKDKIQGADLADMQLISKYYQRSHFLYFGLLIFLKVLQLLVLFKNCQMSNRKPRIWAD